MGEDECSDFKNPIGRPAKEGLSGNRIFAETGKSRLSVKPRRACPVLTGWAGSFTKGEGKITNIFIVAISEFRSEGYFEV